LPPIRSRIKSAWPLCAAYSAIIWISAKRKDISPHSSLTNIVSSGRP
jgi:hypothetical protein